MPSTRSKDEFTELLIGCQRRVVACIYAMVHNMADTQEVFQEVCVTMWEKFDAFQPDTDFAKWACSISHLTALGFLHKRESGRIAFGDEFLDEYAAWEQRRKDVAEDRRAVALRGCMERLSDNDRRLVQLRYSGTQKAADIAQQMGRSPQSLSKSLGRIRGWLFECVQRTLAAEGC